MEEKNRTKRILCTIFIVVVMCVVLIPFFNQYLLSTQNYRPREGILGSDSAGFKHYSNFVDMPYFSRLFGNTFTISLISLITGALYTFLAALAIGGTKNKILKGIFTIVFCFPAIIPHQLIVLGVKNLDRSLFVENGFMLQFIVGMLDGIKFAPFAVIAALFIKTTNVAKNSLKVSLLFIAIRLMIFFTNDLGTILSSYNPATYESLDTFSSFVYRRGFGGEGGANPWSFAAAASMFTIFLQLITAGGACAIMIKLTKKKDVVPEISEESTWAVTPWIATLAIPTILFLFTAIYGGAIFPYLGNPFLKERYIYGFMYACISASLVSAAAIGIAKLGRNAGIVGIICLTIMCVTSPEVMISRYLTIKELDFLNKPIGPIVQNLYIIPLASVVYTFIIKENRGKLVDLSVAIIGFMLLFAWFWGDYYAPMLTLQKAREFMPISVTVSNCVSERGSIDSKPFTAMVYIMIPIIITMAGGILAGILSGKEKKNNINHTADNNIQYYSNMQ